jgi:hypothetical protein
MPARSRSPRHDERQLWVSLGSPRRDRNIAMAAASPAMPSSEVADRHGITATSNAVAAGCGSEFAPTWRCSPNATARYAPKGILHGVDPAHLEPVRSFDGRNWEEAFTARQARSSQAEPR